MAAVRLSERLTVIASMVRKGASVADIGTDHAYLPVALLSEKRISHAIAMDVRKGPLSHAETDVRQAGLSDSIECRLSDGFDALSAGEADTAVIAGMGGILITDILRRGEKIVRTLDELILEPQSEPDRVRRCLSDLGFLIDCERMVREENKFYPVIHCVNGEKLSDEERTSDRFFRAAAEEEWLYGPCLLARRDPVLYDCLKKQEKVYTELEKKLASCAEKQVLSPGTEARRKEISETLRCIGCALQRYTGGIAADGSRTEVM